MKGLNGLNVFIFELPLIYKIEKQFSPITLVVIGVILMVLSSLSLVIIPIAIIAALVYVLFSTMGEILSFPFSSTFALSFTNDKNRGRYMGFYTMTFSIARAIAPLGWFIIADNFGYDFLYVTGFVAALLASFIIYRSHKVLSS